MQKPYLDTCRGIAILLVIAVHVGIASQGPEFLFFGQRGVQMFFIVSAFTLCMSVRSRTGEGSAWGAFYIRRFWRVAPMYYLALVANTILEAGSNLGSHPALAVLTTLTFTHGLIPQYINTTVIGGWSVAVEFCFYALFPFIYHYLTNWRLSVIALFTSVIVCSQTNALLANAYPTVAGYFQFTWVVAELPVFLMGFLAFHLRENFIMRVSPQKQKAVAAGLLVIALVLAYVSLPTRDASLYVSSLAFVPALLALSLVPCSWIVNRASVSMGIISYSAYLIHFFVLAGLKVMIPAIWTSALPTGLVGFVIYYIPTIAGTSFLSWITWRWIEQPGIALGRALITKLQISKISFVRSTFLPARE
jgi:peptidoglycan/LPS O-acetylase OafA/YrhL